MTEKFFQKKVIKALTDAGWLVLPIAGRSNRGIPDLVAMRDCVVCFVELKTNDGELSPHQEAMFGKILATGTGCVVLRPKDFGWK